MKTCAFLLGLAAVSTVSPSFAFAFTLTGVSNSTSARYTMYDEEDNVISTHKTVSNGDDDYEEFCIYM